MRPRTMALAVTILALAGGCGTADPAPSTRAPAAPPTNLARAKSTPTPATTPTQLRAEDPATPAAPRPGPSVTATYPAITTPVHAAGWSTSIPEVDAVIAATLSGDVERMRGVVGSRAVPCFDVGHPLHPATVICAGKPEGSEARGFAQGYGEWRYYEPDTVPLPAADGLKGVYAVVRIDGGGARPEAYQWARPGDYVAVLVPARGVPSFDAVLVLIEDGKWIGVTPGSVAEAFSASGIARHGTLVLAPPPGAPPLAPPTPRGALMPATTPPSSVTPRD